MERVAIFAALRWECAPIIRRLRQARRQRIDGFQTWQATVRGRDVLVVKTGIGMDQAAAAATAASRCGSFDLFLSTGCAGGLAADLLPGDLAIASSVVSSSPSARFETDGEQRTRLEHIASRAGLRNTTGSLLCSREALATAAAKQAAAVAHGSVAVDMEGASIAACAARLGVPFAAVRAILDGADSELRHAGKLIDPQSGAVRPLALASYLAAHPSAVADLRAMQRMMHAAQDSLDRFFAVWLEAAESSPSTFEHRPAIN
jgi:adenosylhomocysteine nucleosidase